MSESDTPHRNQEFWVDICSRNVHRVEAVQILTRAGWSIERIAFVLMRTPGYVERTLKKHPARRRKVKA